MDVLKGKSVQQVREAFGMQPFMIACWTCYLGCCNEAAIKALQAASDARLLEVLATLRKEGNEHPGQKTPKGVRRVLRWRTRADVSAAVVLTRVLQFVEWFCGTGNLTTACSQQGLRVRWFDYTLDSIKMNLL